MNRIFTILLLVVITIIGNNTKAQPWNSLLPQSKLENGKLTLHDYQKAFNDYWAPKNVERGYYIENGVKTKAGGWKQFKRWEWYWETRVNPSTGAFSTICPAYMTSTRSQKPETILKSCVIKSIAILSSFCKSSRSSNTSACTVTSSAVVGSSAIRRSGSQASAIAKPAPTAWPSTAATIGFGNLSKSSQVSASSRQ